MIIRRASLVVVALLAGILIAIFLSGPATRIVYWRLAFSLGLLLLTSWVWTSLMLRHVDLRRETRSLRYQVGQVFEERFEIYNRSRLGIVWLEVRDLSPLPGKQHSRVLAGVGGRGERFFVTRSLLRRRGAYSLGPTMLISGDPFGFFAVRKAFPPEKTLLVLPYTVDLSVFPSPPGQLPGGRVLRRRSTEVTPYAAGVREYMPGDPLNRIHWRSTARRDRLMVKEFEQDPQADVWIFLDAYRHSHISQEDTVMLRDKTFWIWSQRLESPLPPNTFEYAVSAAASIGRYYLAHGRALGFACASQSLSVLPAERGDRQLSKLLEVLAFVQSNGHLPLPGLVQSQAGYLVRGTTVVLITVSEDTEVVPSVEMLLRRDLTPIVVLIDRRSFGGYGDTDSLRERIANLGALVFVIQKGADLRLALEVPQSLALRF